MTAEGLHRIGPERLNDVELQHRLQTMQECNPTFVLIVGNSFGLFNSLCDDQLAMATFIGRFRDVPIDIYVCSPQLEVLAGFLGEEIRSKRVHAFPVYWNVLASAFEQVIAGNIDVTELNYIHKATLDTRGPGILPAPD